MSGWLDAADWKRVQDTVPIACVDLLPMKLTSDGRLERVGLIFRDTPHQQMRWCVVGGRLRHNESLHEAVGRQIRETLGDAVKFDLPAEPQPDYVSQYFTARRPIGLVDPRQHALTLNFCVPITGEPVAQGEAASFQWFEPNALPASDTFGFEQDRVVKALLNAWAARENRPGL